jgi:hypothetical protein
MMSKEEVMEAVNLIDQEYHVSGYHIMSEKEHKKYIDNIKQALEQKEQLEKELERYKETNNDIKDTITIYLELQGKIFSSLTNLNDIEYSNYHKSYKKLKKLVEENDE